MSTLIICVPTYGDGEVQPAAVRIERGMIVAVSIGGEVGTADRMPDCCRPRHRDDGLVAEFPTRDRKIGWRLFYSRFVVLFALMIGLRFQAPSRVLS